MRNLLLECLPARLVLKNSVLAKFPNIKQYDNKLTTGLALINLSTAY